MASYEKINYLLRPNKSVERKMICEMLAGISNVADITGYQYIGLGSTYFADFSLFHRRLGISKMISIEADDEAKGRCEFNKPYACIELKIGVSSTVLPNLDINTKDTIIWLDYDGPICDSVFSDIDTVISMMKTNSFFMLSLNADIKTLEYKNGSSDNLIELLAEIVGEDRFPSDYLGKQLTQKLYSIILYECLHQQILSTVQKRNGMEDLEVVFHQTLNFVYRDGARMITVGGFLFDKSKEDENLTKMMIRQLPYYRNGKDFFSIQCPVLSLKEIQALNAFLPCKPMDKESCEFEIDALNKFPINNQDIDSYASLYRYYPKYVESLL